MSEINHEFTDEIVCPYCGNECRNSWEFSDEDRYECDECGKEFFHTRNVSIDYSTEKICKCDHTESWHLYSNGSNSGPCGKKDYIEGKYDVVPKECDCKEFKSI